MTRIIIIIISFQSSDVIVPDLIRYDVTIDNSGDIISEAKSLSPDATEHSFNGIQPNATYTVSVTAVNGVGTSVTSTTIGKIFC